MHADRPLRLAVALAALLALPACGETARIQPSSHATPRPVPSVPATVFPAPTRSVAPTTSESAPASGSASASATKPAGNAVLAAGTTFTPASLTVKKGTKVTWTADGFHSVTSGEPAAPDPKGPMSAPIGFSTYSVTFAKAGTYKYFCEPHKDLGMTGEIVVT